MIRWDGHKVMNISISLNALKMPLNCNSCNTYTNKVKDTNIHCHHLCLESLRSFPVSGPRSIVSSLWTTGHTLVQSLCKTWKYMNRWLMKSKSLPLSVVFKIIKLQTFFLHKIMGFIVTFHICVRCSSTKFTLFTAPCSPVHSSVSPYPRQAPLSWYIFFQI